MTFTGLLGHRATIRSKQGGDDRFGQPTKDLEESGISGIPCRLRGATGREVTDFQARDNLVVTHILYANPGLAITEADKVLTVVDLGDNQLLADADVVLVRKISEGAGHGHHLEIALRALRANA